MTSFYRRILDRLLPQGTKNSWLGVIPVFEEDKVGSKKASGHYYVPPALYPNGHVVHISSGKYFLDSLESLISDRSPRWLFMIAPRFDSKSLSSELQQKYQHQRPELIAVQIALNALPPESTLVTLVPSWFLIDESLRGAREALLCQRPPDERSHTKESDIGLWLVIEHNHPLTFFDVSSIHPAFRMTTVAFRKGSDIMQSVRFFKYPWIEDGTGQDEVLDDLSRLLMQGGGKTRYGYVLREGLSPGSKWSFDLHSPETVQKKQELKSLLGEIRPLQEIFKIVRGMPHPGTLKEVQSEPASGYVRLVTGRCISRSGCLDFENDIKYVKREGSVLLEEGDICVSRICTEGVVAAEVSAGIEACANGATVIALRPKANVTPEEREFYFAYLRSPVAWSFLSDLSSLRGSSILRTDNLRSLPMPYPDQDIIEALQDLSRAGEFMEFWRDEIDSAKRNLFNFTTSAESRPKILGVGRRCRQRVAAAIQVDRLDYRVRTQFPHPLAFRWRTVEASNPDTDGYEGLLECAEVAAFFMAAISIAVVQDSGGTIGYLETMASRMSSSGRGTNFGDWVAILVETRDSKPIKKLSEQTAFVEILRFLDDSDAFDSLRILKQARDDKSHGRGPRGSNAIAKAFDEQKLNLEKFFSAMEFLTDYTLIVVEDVRPDTLRQETEYSYRVLTGDHPLVPLQHDGLTKKTIEKDSMYFVGKKNELLLLRPFLQRLECPECGNIATFYLDRYDQRTRECCLKSMEHGHTLPDKSIVDPLRQIGLLM
ncbi:MAG: hypothetical protein ACLQPD_35380 [Desulfomonilaceae bacterium]